MTVKEWYSPHAVTKFTRAMVKWLIPHLPLLRAGSYPRNPKESGYTDSGIKSRQFKAGASFETPAGIAAELDLRIQRAGMRGDRIHDGLLLELLYCTEPDDEIASMQHLSQAHGITIKEISQRIRNAL